MPPDIFNDAALTPEQRDALARLQTDLGDAQSYIKKLEIRIQALEDQAMAEHFILTRPEFNREVARMLAFDERYGGVSSVLYYDIAGLTALTTKHTPAVASEAIKVITHVLMGNMRRSDIAGRLGVDEFGILLVRCDNNNAWKKGRQLASLLANALDTISGVKLGLDISFGAYTFREEEDVVTGLKQASDSLTKIGAR